MLGSGQRCRGLQRLPFDQPRKAGYTFDYDSGDYGDFTVHMGKTWIMEEVSGGGYRQTIVIETQLTQDVMADAVALSRCLTTSSHAVVNGILIDTGKAAVKPESAPALQEVVKLLEQDPKLKVYVVDHTDKIGALAANPARGGRSSPPARDEAVSYRFSVICRKTRSKLPPRNLRMRSSE